MLNYTPRNWFWLADDGRVYGSAVERVVDDTDAAYLAWSSFNTASPWPRDAGGQQTVAALQDVLTPYGLFADLSAYAADRRWRREVVGIVFAGLAIATDDRSKQMILGARVAAEADVDFTTPWVGADGAIMVLDAAQIVAVSNAVAAHVAMCFQIYADVIAAIDAGTITTALDVDQAFAV